MKIIFAGTPEFSATILNYLINSSHTVIACYTQPDRPKGRGKKMAESPVKLLAQSHAIPVYQPVSLRDESAQIFLKNLNADVMVVAAYGLILPTAILNAPKDMCINVHTSLLPAWRGAAPVQRAIEAGDTKTGVTIMKMDAGLDTGDILLTRHCPILKTTTSETLLHQLAHLGAEALLETLSQLKTLTPTPQDSTHASYAKKIEKEEGRIHWSLSASELDRKIRAFNPWPGCYTHDFKIWQAEPVSTHSTQTPGTLIAVHKDRIDVATGAGILSITHAQWPGGKIMPMQELLRAKKDFFKLGTLLS